MSKRKPIQGIGINDAPYVTQKCIRVDGKNVHIETCPFYLKWKGMFDRCYSEKELAKHETYRGCSVCDEWVYFTAFRKWMEKQDWEGNQLDKDILYLDNKIYSPTTCVFVHPKVNTFLINRTHDRGQCLVGVSLERRTGLFIAYCSNPFTGGRERLGRYNTELEAHLAWKSRKHELACQLADSEYVTDERVANALRTRYLNNLEHL